jgi:gamma-glutamyltranspeptidase / glutathione hydrolase
VKAVATSQPTATDAGMRALHDGGTAVDAALAAAAVLCVTEPMMTGPGGDAFAIVRTPDGRAEGLDAAGPAPANVPTDDPPAWDGPTSVTVPGAVAGWAALAARHGRLGLDRALHDAIDCAEQGFEVQPHCAGYWQRAARLPEGYAPAPTAGDWVRLPSLAASLRAIAEEGPDVVYRGRIADAVVEGTWLEESDLASYTPLWVEPLRGAYRNVQILELPPPTQGVAALEALALLDGFEPTLPAQVACVRLALEDAFAHVRDGADVSGLLEPDAVERRRSELAPAVGEPQGSTTYLCTLDDDGMAVSFIQSLFDTFGSGLEAPGTGVVLQNRGACFGVSGSVEPGRRPYHTIIPGMLLRADGALLGPFGVAGGFLQAQGHLRFVSAVVDDGLDPQAALDRPRFRVEGDRIALEPELAHHAPELPGAYVETDLHRFGGGQAIIVSGDGSVSAGSDRRKDGYAAVA